MKSANTVTEIPSETNYVVAVEKQLVIQSGKLAQKEIVAEAVEKNVVTKAAQSGYKGLKKLIKGTNAVGGLNSATDNAIEAYNDFSKGNIGRGSINTAQSAAYLTGTIMLFTPLAPFGLIILEVTSVSDIGQGVIETQTGTNY